MLTPAKLSVMYPDYRIRGYFNKKGEQITFKDYMWHEEIVEYIAEKKIKTIFIIMEEK
jgi:hypothetical protein